MQRNQHRDASTPSSRPAASAETAASSQEPARQLDALLVGAAQVAVEREVDLEDFMSAAWTAYVETRPGYRKQLEEQRMAAEIAVLRERGLVGQA